MNQMLIDVFDRMKYQGPFGMDQMYPWTFQTGPHAHYNENHPTSKYLNQNLKQALCLFSKFTVFICEHLHCYIGDFFVRL